MERRDLVIAGAGQTSGGVFNMVKVSGKGTIMGNVDCSDLSIHGAVKMEGDVKAEAAQVSGKLHLAGSLQVEIIKVSGKASIEENLECKVMRVHGNVDVKGKLNAEEAYIDGEVEVAGDCSSEVFDARGCFTIGGLLNAEKIQIKLYGYCCVQEMGGETIQVKISGIPVLKRLFSQVGLSAEIIEGDEIELEYTNAKIVRGNRVVIGPGCNIERVEYRDTFHCDKEANINTYQKL